MISNKEEKKCLNCGSIVSDHYCSNCGQDIEIEPFTLKRIILTVLFYGILNRENGYLNSVIVLFKRPGHAVRRYVNGHRVEMFNYFSFLIIAIILGQLTHNIIEYFYPLVRLEKDETEAFFDFFGNNRKLIYVFLLPIKAVITFVIFRKSKNNYAEHFVLNTYKFSGQLMIGLVFIVINAVIVNTATLDVLGDISLSLKILFSLWFNYQFFSVFYKKKELIIRVILSEVLEYVFVAIGYALIFILFEIITNPDGLSNIAL